MKDETNAYRDKQIKEIDEKSMKNYEKLEMMCDGGFITCLDKYCENYSFIEWLREATPSNFI